MNGQRHSATGTVNVRLALLILLITLVHRSGSFLILLHERSIGLNRLNLNGSPVLSLFCSFLFQAAKLAKTKCGSSRPRVAVARCKAWQLQHQALPGGHMEATEENNAERKRLRRE